VSPAATSEVPLDVAVVHEHDWRQRAILYEDGLATEELECPECGGVTFR
jgi:hypothetical protein